MGQVVKELTILRYPRGFTKKGLITPQNIYSAMYSHSFQDTKFKLLREVKDFMGQVVKGWTILRYPMGFTK